MVKEMIHVTDIEKLKKLTGESDDILLSLLLEEATAFVLSYTGRTKIVTGLEKAIRDLAVIALNRMGTEGEASRSGGGESYSFDNAPKHIYDTLDRYRLVRIGGKTYEAKTEQAGNVPSPGGNT
jgi:DNA packaging protein, QLRG family